VGKGGEFVDFCGVAVHGSASIKKEKLSEV
jgi:hypothetical protein